MPVCLLVFEFLGTTELMVIAVVALIIFGPRKLPEIGRTLGRSLAEFKRASDDFKRTWEYEVEMEQRKPALPNGQESNDADEVTAGDAAEVSTSSNAATHEEQTIARNSFGAETSRAPGNESNTAAEGGATFDEMSADDDELNAS